MKVPKMRKTVVSQPKTKDGIEPYQDIPSISFTEKQLPGIKDWNLNDEYYLCIKVKMVSSSVVDYGSNKGSVQSRFNILAVGVDEDED